MANYTAQYTFGVSADTKNAQGSLDALSKSLRSIQTSKYTLQVNDQSVVKAAEAASTLQTALRNATNVNTGKLDLSKFQAQLKESNTSLQQLGQQLINSGQQGQQAFQQLASTIASAQAPVRQLSKAFATVGTTIMNTIKWQAASSLIHGLMSSISGAISYAKNLNSTLNDIQIVTGASSDQMARFAETANRAAKSLSTSTNEFAKASLIYYQQGDNAATAAKKAEITTKAANVAFTASAQEMSQMLTAVWNSFQMGEDQLEHAVDVMAKLGANTASSMEEMAKAMQKVAATANTVGISMDKMAAIVATSASVTRQAPETIGTAWNTILNRISNLKLGETLEDGVDLTKYTAALEKIGVNVLDATGQLRDMGSVVDEIGAKWQTLDKSSKAALASTLGGVRQYTQINAFFENFDKYQKNLKEYTGSAASGELNKQQEIYAQSWEAASKRVKASMEGVYAQLIDDKAITKLTSLLADVINFGTQLTSTFGGLGNVLSLVVTQIAQANIEKLSTKIQEAGISIKNLFTGNKTEITEYRASIAETIKDLNNIADNSNTSASMNTSIQFDVEILKMKDQLIEKEGQLTEAQKKSAQQVIENMQANKQYYVELMKNQEEAIKSLQQTKEATAQQMKERIAERTDPELYRDNKATSYAATQQQLRVANHMVMDVMPEDVATRVGLVLEKMGQIKSMSDDITVGKLLHSLQQAAEEAGKFEAIMNQASEKFGTKSGKWDAKQWEGTDEDRKAMIMSLADKAASSSDQNVADKGVDLRGQLEGIDPSNVQALNGILQQLQQALGQAETSAENSMNTLKEGAESAGQNVDKLVEKARDVGRATGEMADDAKNSMNRFKQTFQQTLEGSSKKIQKFVQGAIAIQRVASAFTAIGNAVNKLKDPNVGAWEKFTTVLGTLVTIGFAVSSVMTYIKANQTGLIGSMIGAANAAIADAAAQGVHATAYGVLSAAVEAAKKAIQSFMTSNPIGWILLVVAAVVALTVAIASLVAGANEKWAQSLADRQKDLAESMNDTSEKANKLHSDLANLQTIMHDTSLTYDEQLSKINEICAAYGIQASMLDVLSGNYAKLAGAMTNAAQAESGRLAQQAETDEATALSLANERVQQSQADNFWTGAGKILLGSAIGALTGPIGATLGAALGISEVFGQKTVTNTFNRQHDVKDAEEKAAIAGLSDQLDAIGFKVNAWGEIAEKSAGSGDSAALLKLLRENEDLTKYASNSSSYTAQLAGHLAGLGYDTVLEARQQKEDLKLQNELLNNEDLDLFGLKTSKAGVRDVAKLINSTSATTEAQREKLSSYLSSFDNYSEAAAQYSALNQFAGTAAQARIDMGVTVGNKEEITQQIIDDLLEDETLEVEAIVKIDPTDVIFDEETGKYKLDEKARKFAEDQLAHTRAITRQSTLEENKDIMTADSISRADYETLWQSGLFETEAELQAFVMQSSESRAQMWQSMYDDAIQAEIAAMEASVADAEERIPELTERVDNWHKQLAENSAELVAKGIFTEDEIAGMSGEEIYQEMINRRAKAQGAITSDKEIIEAYKAAKEGDDDTRKAFARKYLGQDNWDANKAEKYAQEVQTRISANETLVANLDEQVAEGEALMANLAATEQVVVDNAEGLGRDEYYEWAKAVDEATEAAEEFNAAMTMQGSVTAESLAKLAKYDSDIYSKYQNMNAAEWTEYAYTQAMSYYAEMEQLYQNDAAMLAEINQQKAEATRTYYEELKKQAEAATAADVKAFETYIERINNAIDKVKDLSLDKSISSLGLDKIEEFRQAIEAAGLDYDAFIKKITPSSSETDKEAMMALADAKTNLMLRGEQSKLKELQTVQSLIPIKTSLEVEPPLSLQSDGIGVTTVNGQAFVDITPENYEIFFNQDGTLKPAYADATYSFYAKPGDGSSACFTVAGDYITGLQDFDDGSASYQLSLKDGTYVSVGADGICISPASGEGKISVTDVDSGTTKVSKQDDGSFKIEGTATGSGSVTIDKVTEGSANVKVDGKTGNVEITSDITGSGTITANLADGNGIEMTGDTTFQITATGAPGAAAFYGNLETGGDFKVGKNGAIEYTGKSPTGSGTFSAKFELAEISDDTNINVDKDGNVTISNGKLNTIITIDKENLDGLSVNENGIVLPDLDPESAKKYVELWIKEGNGFTYENGVLTLAEIKIPTLTQYVSVEYLENRKRLLDNSFDTLEGYYTSWVEGSSSVQGVGVREAAQGMNRYKDFIWPMSGYWEHGYESLYDYLYDPLKGADNRSFFAQAAQNVFEEASGMFELGVGPGKTWNYDQFKGSDMWKLASLFASAADQYGFDWYSLFANGYDDIQGNHHSQQEAYEAFTSGFAHMQSGRSIKNWTEEEILMGQNILKHYYNYDNGSQRGQGIEWLRTLAGDDILKLPEFMKELGYESFTAFRSIWGTNTTEPLFEDVTKALFGDEDVFTDEGGFTVAARSALEGLKDLGPEYEALGRFWMQGLVAGMNDTQLFALAQSLGYGTVEEFKAAWGIASPSKVARQLGRYFIQGLNIGLAEEGIEVGDLSQQLIQQVKDNLDEALPSVQESLDEFWKQALEDENFNWKDYLDESTKYAYEHGYISEAAAKSSAKQHWQESQGTSMFLEESGLKTRGYNVIQGKNVNKIANTGVDIADNLWYVIDSASGKILTDFEATMTKKAQTAALFENIWSTDTLTNELVEYADGGFFGDRFWTSAQKLVLETIFEEAKEKLGISSDKTFAQWMKEGGSLEALLAAVDEAYTSHTQELENALKVDWESIKQNYLTALDEMRKADEEYAKEVQKRWESVWTSIGKLRKAALSGEETSIIDELDKSEDRINYMKTILADYTDAEGNIDFVAMRTHMMTKGQIDLTSPTMQMGSFASMIASNRENYRFLNQAENGVGFTSTSYADYQRNRRAVSIAEHKANLEMGDYFGDTVSDTNVFKAYGFSPQDLLAAADIANAAQAAGTVTTTNEYARAFVDALGLEIDQISPEMLDTILNYGLMAEQEISGGVIKGDDGNWYMVVSDGEGGEKQVDMAEYLATLKYEKEISGMTDEALHEEYVAAGLAGEDLLYNYVIKTKKQIDTEHKAITDVLDTDTKLAEKVLKGETLGAEELKKWTEMQDKYGSTGGSASETMGQIALQRAKEDERYSIQTQLAGKGIYEQYDQTTGTSTWASIDGQTTYDSMYAAAQAMGITAEASSALESYEKSLASAVGYTTEEFQALEAQLNENNIFDISTAEGRMELMKFAAAIAKVRSGYEELGKITTDTWKLLKDKTKRGTKDYLTQVENLRKTMSKIFNVDMARISSDFAEKHIEQMHKMATGTEKEALAARDVIEDDLVAEVMKLQGTEATVIINAETGKAESALTYLQNALDQWDGKDYGFTITADASEAEANVINSMNSILASGQMTADQISEALNAIGWEPEIEYTVLTASGEQYSTTTGQLKVGDGYITTSGEMRTFAEGDIIVPHIKSARKTSGASAKPPKSSGGGGGGGKKKHDEKKDSEKERYHQVDQSLERQNALLSQNDKLKSRKYGNAYLKSLEAENKIIEQQIKLNKQKNQEAQEYYAQDRADLESYGATFAEDGTVNYEEYMDKWISWYNEKANQEMEEEDWKKVEEEYEKAMEALKNYEDSMAKLEETENQVLELENKRSQLAAEKITYKLQIRVELNQNDLKTIEYFLSKYANSYNSLAYADDSMDKMIDKMSKYQDNLEALDEAHRQLDADFAAGIINQADYIEKLKEINEQIVTNLTDIDALDKTMREWYGQTLNAASGKLATLTDRLTHLNTVSNNYIEILKLTGRELEYDKIAELYGMQVDVSMAKTRSAKEYLRTLKEQKDALEAALALNPDDDMIKQQLEDLTKEYNKAMESFQQAGLEALNAIQNQFNTTVDAITYANKHALDSSGRDVDWLKQKWQWWNDEQEIAVDTITELYEVNKLNRKIEDAIAKERDKTNAQNLKNLKQEINLRAENNQLTKYNLEMMDLQYQLLMKKQELENAQNAKNTVRLTRDESGNYIYQYTADQEAISKKQQEYEDVLYQINQKAEEEYKRLGNQYFQYAEEFEQKLDELMHLTNISDEERYRRKEEIFAHYKPLLQKTADQMGEVWQNLEINQGIWIEDFGADMVKNTGFTNDQISTLMDDIVGNVDNFLQTVEDGYNDRFEPALEHMQTAMQETSELLDADWESITSAMSEAETETQAVETAISSLTSTLGDSLTGIRNATAAWAEQEEQLKRDIEYYEDLNEKINEVIRSQADLQTTTAQVPDVDTGEEQSSEEQSETPSQTPEPISEPEGGGQEQQPQQEQQEIWYNDGEASAYQMDSEKHWKEQKQKSNKGRTRTRKVNEGSHTKDSGTEDNQGRRHYKCTVCGYDMGFVYAGGAEGVKIKQGTNKSSVLAEGLVKLATGGRVDYTGPAWLDGTPERPEYVLNADQTESMFGILESDTVSKLVITMRDATAAMLAGLRSNLYNTYGSVYNGANMAQEVNIYAEFPNATDRNEIQEALNSLVARASQNAVSFIR